MKPFLLRIVAAFLERLAESLRPLEVGMFGPDRYAPGDAKRIGPLIAAEAANGVIQRAGPGTSCRASRHAGLVNFWITNDPGRCRERAAELRRLADLFDDDGNDKRQTLLF